MTAKRFIHRVMSPDSPWNQKLADDAPLITDYGYKERLQHQTQYTQGASPISGPYLPGFTTTIQQASFAVPIYVATQNHPLSTVTVVHKTVVNGNPVYTPYTSLEDHGLQGLFAAVPVPDPAECLDGRIGSEGSDQTAVFVRMNEDGVPVEAWECWRFEWNDTLGWICQYGAYIPDIYNHLGFFPYHGVRANGTPSIAGLILNEDFESGVIPHALHIAIANPGEHDGLDDHMGPCRRGDTSSFDLNGTAQAIEDDKIRHGFHGRLLPDFDIQGWVQDHGNDPGVNPVALEALLISNRDYGIFVGDSARGVVQFIAEDSRTLGTIYSPWETRPTGLGTIDRYTIGALPWDSFHQLAEVDPLSSVWAYDTPSGPKQYQWARP